MITWPFALAPGVISCMRLRHLMRVVLPQPEGPINAVTVFSFTYKLMFFNACLVPNHASRFFTDTLWTFCCCCSLVDCFSLSIVLSIISSSVSFYLLRSLTILHLTATFFCFVIYPNFRIYRQILQKLLESYERQI
jgi:hypothetical protein